MAHFQKLFWGSLFVLLEVHLFVVDVLLDPLGYLLILIGVKGLMGESTYGKKARWLALSLVFLSIPTVFIQQNVGIGQMEQASPITGWPIYMFLLGLLKLVLVFYLFQILLLVATTWKNEELIKGTAKTLKAYMIIMLSIHITQSFTMNVSNDVLTGYALVSLALDLIMEITFLVLLHRFGKQGEDDSGERSILSVRSSFETDHLE